MEDNIFEVWNYKYNQYVPCKILKILDSRFIKVREFIVRKEVIEEIETLTYSRYLRNTGEKSFNALSMFPSSAMINTKGMNIIVDKAEYDNEGNIRIYYKYLECDEDTEREIKSTSPAWSWINSYGAQMKKVNPGYNFITLRPEDSIEFRSFIPSRLEDHRKEWYFEDPVSRDVIVYLENLLGYTRPDGDTWMEYFWKHTDGKNLGIKIKEDNLVCIDMTDPKKPVQVCSVPGIEEFIEEVVRYIEVI